MVFILGQFGMVFSIVGLSEWILLSGPLQRGTPRNDLFLCGNLPTGFLPRRIRINGLSGNRLLRRGTLRHDPMQRATLQTGLLQWGLLNHDALRSGLFGVVFSLVRLSDLVVSIVRLSGKGSPLRYSSW